MATKKRKKKNLKLRRQIWKTVSAILMIMAIVVAAIPVERYGRMEASTTPKTNVNYIDDWYGDYIDYVDVNTLYQLRNNNANDAQSYDRDESASNVIASIDTVGSSTPQLTYRFKYKDRTSRNGAVIVYADPDLTGAVNVGGTMYADYWIITPGLLNKTFKEKCEPERFGIGVNFSSTNVVKDSTTFTVPNTFALSYKYYARYDETQSNNPSSSQTVSMSLQLDGNTSSYYDGITESQFYNNIYGATNFVLPSVEAKEIIQKFLSGQESEQQGELDNIQRTCEEILKDINDAPDGTLNITNITDRITEVNGKISNFEKRYSIDNVNDINDYFCRRLQVTNTQLGNTTNLKDYQLSQVNDLAHGDKLSNEGGDKLVYALKLKDGAEKGQNDNLDRNNYLVTKSITIRGIGNEVFKDIQGLNKVTLDESIYFVGDDAFHGCTNLQSAYLPYAYIIGDRAFKGCEKLEDLTLIGSDDSGDINHLTMIGTQAFDGCASLKEVSFPNSLTDIGPAAFAKCSSLEHFNIKASAKIWPFAFYDCINLSNEDDEHQYYSTNSNATIQIGLGTFAVSSGNAESARNLTEFAYPERQLKMIDDAALFQTAAGSFLAYVVSEGHYGATHSDPKNEFMYDYTLANRKYLDHVTFSPNMGLYSSEPANKVKIPDNTLAGCENLGYVTFGQLSYTGTMCNAVTYDTEQADTDNDGETLFQDIKNTNFYVEGPGYYSKSSAVTYVISTPREITRYASTNVSDQVPYKFLDVNENNQQVTYIEDTKGSFLATLVDTNDDKTTATLVSYSTLGTPEYCRLTVPNKIGDYTITSVAPGCFEQIKQHVVELVIEDGVQIEKIEEDAFKGCEGLLQVKIGNCVREIGNGAFSGCKKLENVYFSHPENISDDESADAWANAMIIGEDAFKTNSDYLTFHGPIHAGYAPYEYAMKATNTLSENSKKNICYKEVAPGNLTVMIDKVTNKATLIDYPHYEDIDLQNGDLIESIVKDYNENYDNYTGPNNPNDYSILAKWENSHGYRADTDYSGVELRSDEEQVVLFSLFPTVPSGVESVDAAAFYNQADNRENWDYITRYYVDNKAGLPGGSDIQSEISSCIQGDNDYNYTDNAPDPELRNVNRFINSNKNVEKLYSTDNYYKLNDSTMKKDQPGLYSGYFSEIQMLNKKTGNEVGIIGQTYNNWKLIENETSGNDHLLGVTLDSVRSLPDYAFNSCENLGFANLSGDFEEFGVAPFRGCIAMESIAFGTSDSNANFIYANGILYRKIDGSDTNLEIVEVMSGRGYLRNLPAYSINKDNDPNLQYVTKIAKEAFADNPYIDEVDLSETKVEEIPDGCFANCTELVDVTLPGTVSTIGEKAFENIAGKVNIHFTSPFCTISDSAFDNNNDLGHTKAKFYGQKYTDSSESHKSPIYTYYERRTGYIEFAESAKTYLVKLYNYNAQLLDVRTVESGGSIMDEDLDNLESTLTRTNYTFTGWAWDQDGDLSSTDDIVTGDTVLKSITQDRVLIAQYKLNAETGDGQKYKLTIVNGYAGSGDKIIDVLSGSTMSVRAYPANNGYRFGYWGSNVEGVTFTSPYLESTYFVMPNCDLTVTAYYVDSSGNVTDNSASNTGGATSDGSAGNNNNNNNNNNDDDDKGKYKLTVNYGSGSGNYDAGKSVTITAYAPEAKNKVFSHWSTSSSEVAFASTTSATTTLVMPKKDVTVTANYKTRSSSDDDDDDDDDDRDAWNKRHDSTTATTNRNVNTGTTANTGTTGNTGANTQTTPDSGTRLDIQSNGISNKDMGSANVSGSTDNFVIKISDSADAKAAVEAALIDKYGSLDGLAYFPMDISLYDPSGKNKVIDTSGLSVSITIPIPDELIQYGGNNLAGAVNSANKMEDLVARFTTIDGIGCITFTATHFSPYAIYVDTNNLVAGQTMDATPKTGDGIHPKWFLAIALACMSIAVFMVSDKKKVRTAI